MLKTRLLIANTCYHVMARGNQQQNIFLEIDDFNFYLHQLKHYKRKYKILLYSYCLMPNHIHLIVEPLNPEKLSKFMQGLQRSYTAYFNEKYEKVGHLWQGRFKAKIISKDEYLINVITYVEYNPVKANIVKHPQDYIFSSYRERSSHQKTKRKLIDPLLIPLS